MVFHTMNDPFHESIENAVAQTANARTAWLAAWEAYFIASSELERTKVDMITGGYVVGKNAEERSANLDKLVEPQAAGLRDATIAERRARMVLENAEDRLRSLLAIAAVRARS